MKKRFVAAMILAVAVCASGCSGNMSKAKNTMRTYEIEQDVDMEEPEELPDAAEKVVTDEVDEVSVDAAEEAGRGVQDAEEASEEVLSENPVDETVYAKSNANVRSGAGTEYEVIGALNAGDSVRRLSVIDNGWSRVEYNGDEAYVSSSLLTNTLPAPAEEVSAEEEKSDDTVAVEVTGNFCTGEAKEIFDLTNAQREAAGLAPLTWSDDLASVAALRCAECTTTFSHTRPDGSSFRTASPLLAAENLIRNGEYMSAEFMVNAWMNSEGHRTNILYPTLKTMGVAILDCPQGRVAVQSYGW